jgi:hypothetical protein
MNSNEIEALVAGLQKRSLAAEVAPRTVELRREMALLMGASHRRLIAILRTAIDAIANKLFVENLSVDDPTTDIQLRILLAANGFDNFQRDVFKTVVRDGEVYILPRVTNDRITWSLVEAYNGSTGAQYIYDSQDPDTLRYAVNMRSDGTTRYLDLYYPDKIEQYRLSHEEWELRAAVEWRDANKQPLGIALVRFDIGMSDVIDAVQIQRDLNEAIIDMVAVSRTMGFPQRFTIGKINPSTVTNGYGSALIDPITNRPLLRSINMAPGNMPHLQDGVDIKQLDPAQPNTTTIDKLLHLLSVVTTVPVFYFNGGEFPSGVALVQAESRLNAKVEGHQGLLTPALIALVRLSLRMSNRYLATRYSADNAISVTWASPEVYTIDLQLEMATNRVDNAMKLKAAGLVSLEIAVRMIHPEWDDTELANEVARITAEQTLT